MQEPNLFYKEQLHTNSSEAKHLYKQMSLYSMLRLLAFGFTVFGVYYFFRQWQIALLVGLLGIAVFLFLLSKYTDLKSKRSLHKQLVTINEEELKIASGDFHHREDGSQFQNPQHNYSLDIDLFGRGSFFQCINRTSIKEGTETLVDLMLSNTITDIEKRQSAIKELSKQPKWSQKYSAIAKGIEIEHSAKSIINWLHTYQPFLNAKLYWGTIGFSILSLLLIALGSFQIIPISIVGYWLIIGIGITAYYLKRINVVARNTSKAKASFKQYAQLLGEIEKNDFKSELLSSQQEKIKTDKLKASQLFSKFSKAIDALDNRNNLISAIFGNGFLLWDIRQTYNIEQWILKYRNKVEDWFKVVRFFDAYNSLGTYAFNHQEFVYPKIDTNSKSTIVAKALGHPLLNADKRVCSDLDLKTSQFFIVTGANMAGKSTFLRTVALHIVMANIGLPVCAKESTYKPIKLITSMRTSDSLTDDSSYFFSELTRLKFIVDTIENKSGYFIILDEILKGTNSTDKAVGSQKFVEKLVNLNATGIIATHDLSLTEIEQQLSEVKNYFFDAQIINDELYFDYTLKEGVCQNMNASFLLKKMEIV